MEVTLPHVRFDNEYISLEKRGSAYKGNRRNWRGGVSHSGMLQASLKDDTTTTKQTIININ
jgi:hypothetical protein